MDKDNERLHKKVDIPDSSRINAKYISYENDYVFPYFIGKLRLKKKSNSLTDFLLALVELSVRTLQHSTQQ